LIAIGNSADSGLVPLTLEQLCSPSALVRGAAVWALARLTSQADFDALARSRLSGESEPSVLAELAKETQSARK
jgi:epoxyqueuosine reductase